MTYVPGLGSDAPHVRCDGCGDIAGGVRKDGFPRAWLLDNKPPPGWRMVRRETGGGLYRRDYCKACEDIWAGILESEIEVDQLREARVPDLGDVGRALGGVDLYSPETVLRRAQDLHADYIGIVEEHGDLCREVDRLRAREAELRDHVLDRSYLAGMSSEDTLDDAESQWWAGYRRAMRDTARRLGADLAPESPRTTTDETKGNPAK